MQKALTKEDLLYILQGIFNISQEPDNAFKMLNDGLFVKNYEQDLENHAGNTDLHIDHALRQILDLLSLDENNNLLYNGTLVNIALSKQDNNALSLKSDGLYAEDIVQDTKDHIADDSIHVTQDDKDIWNQTLQDSKDYTNQEIGKLVIVDIQQIDELPDAEDGSPTTLYILKEDNGNLVPYVFIDDTFIPFSMTTASINLLATKKELEDYGLKKDMHDHDNKDVLDRLTLSESGELMLDGKAIYDFGFSEEPKNGISLIDGKLFVRDYSDEIRSLQIASAVSKTRLYTGDIDETGVYSLADDIDNYTFIMFDYYYKSTSTNDDGEQVVGNAKSIMVDVDTLNELYEKGIDYLIDLGYGISNANSKIHMNGNKLWLNYYNGVCIYKITGIGGVGNE